MLETINRPDYDPSDGLDSRRDLNEIPFGVQFLADSITSANHGELRDGIATGTGTCFDGKNTDTVLDDER